MAKQNKTKHKNRRDIVTNSVEMSTLKQNLERNYLQKIL